MKGINHNLGLSPQAHSGRHRLRLLSICPYKLLPVRDGGQARILGLLKGLSYCGFDVTITCHIVPNVRVEEREIKIESGIHLFNIPSPLKGWLFRAHEVWGVPRIAAALINPVEGFFRRHVFRNFDVVQLELPFLSSWLRWVPQGTLKIFASQNVELDYERDEATSWLLPTRFLSLLERCEREAIRSADLITTVTEADRRRYIQLYDANPEKMIVIPNCVSIDSIDQSAQAGYRERLRSMYHIQANQRVVIFVGSNDPYNRESVELIAREIAPHLPSSRFVFWVVGAAGSMYSGECPAHVKIFGEVENVAPFLSASDLGINPFIRGSGSNVKILDYLAAGLPVLSTDFGMRGYSDLRPFVTIAPVSDFPARIERGVPRPDPTQLKCILARYSWEYQAKRLAEFISCALERKRKSKARGNEV